MLMYLVVNAGLSKDVLDWRFVYNTNFYCLLNNVRMVGTFLPEL